MPGFDAIIGQDLPIRVLMRFLHSAQIPHALMFTGIAGIGKRTTAILFAMALNCDATDTDRPCGQCRTCRQIQAGRHPDVIEVAPVKGMVRIDQIRSLLAALAMRPFSAVNRVVIVTNAQAMNAESANALLKALEEPPADTTIILTALQRDDVLPTIASRCRHIRFKPLNAQALTTLLTDSRALPADQAKTIAEAAEGSYTRALQLVESDWQSRRDWLVHAAGLADKEAKQRPMALALAFSAKLAQKKETLDLDFEILKSWIRDLSVWPHQPGHIVNKDRSTTLAEVSLKLRPKQLLSLWEVVEKAEKDIAANGNLRLTLDAMTLQMAQIIGTLR